MKIRPRAGRSYLTFTVMCRRSEVEREMLKKARVWAPPKAVSFLIHDEEHLDIRWNVVQKVSGRVSFRVTYYDTLAEGTYPVLLRDQQIQEAV